MQHPFEALAPEYAQLLASMVITKRDSVDRTAHRLLTFKSRYADVSAATGVPVVVLATLFERESGSDFTRNLAQGDRWDRVSVHVPKGRGPFASWEAAAKDALHIDRLDAVNDWSWPHALFEDELWNGFGPRNHGIHTGYLWAGTNHYDRGKYVADGVWDPNHRDEQLGVVPIMRRMAELDPSLALPGLADSAVAAPAKPAPTPVGLGAHAPIAGGPIKSTSWLQSALNKVASAELVVDGSYGRNTRRAVIAFQQAHGLETDGLAGPKTFAAVEQTLAA